MEYWLYFNFLTMCFQFCKEMDFAESFPFRFLGLCTGLGYKFFNFICNRLCLNDLNPFLIESSLVPFFSNTASMELPYTQKDVLRKNVFSRVCARFFTT